MNAVSTDGRFWQPGRNQPFLQRSPPSSWKEDHGILTWPPLGPCAAGEKRLWAQKQLEGEGGSGRRKGKCVMKNVDRKAFLRFVPDVSQVALQDVRPQGAAAHQPLGSQLPSSAIRAKEVLWITVLHLDNGSSLQEEPPG